MSTTSVANDLDDAGLDSGPLRRARARYAATLADQDAGSADRHAAHLELSLLVAAAEGQLLSI